MSKDHYWQIVVLQPPWLQLLQPFFLAWFFPFVRLRRFFPVELMMGQFRPCLPEAQSCRLYGKCCFTKLQA